MFVYLIVCLHDLTVQRDVRQGTPTSAGAVPEQRRRHTGGCAVRRTGKTGGRATVPDVRAVRQTDDRGRDHHLDHHHDSGHDDDDDDGRGGVQMEDVAVVGVFGDVRPGHAEQAGELPAPRRRSGGQGHGGRRPEVRSGRGPTAGRAETVPATAALRVRDVGGRHRRRGHGRGRRLRLAAGRVARVFALVRQEGPADEAGVLLPQSGRQEGAPQALRLGRPSAQEAQVQPAPVRRSRVLRRRPAQTIAAVRRRPRGQGLRDQRARA